MHVYSALPFYTKITVSTTIGKVECQSLLTYNSFQNTGVYYDFHLHSTKYLLLRQKLKLRYTTAMNIYLNAASEVLLISIASQNMFNKTAVLTVWDQHYWIHLQESLQFKKVFSGRLEGIHQRSVYIEAAAIKKGVWTEPTMLELPFHYKTFEFHPAKNVWKSLENYYKHSWTSTQAFSPQISYTTPN